MLAKVVSGPHWVECEPAVVPTVARTLYIDVEWFGRVDSKPVRALRTSTACSGCGSGRLSFVDAKGPRRAVLIITQPNTQPYTTRKLVPNIYNPSGVVVHACCLVNYLCLPYRSLLSSDMDMGTDMDTRHGYGRS
jgi:hypothetical protein